MSLTYQVAVPEGQWPSFADMNAALARLGYPMKILTQGDQKPTDPMSEFDGFISFNAEFLGELHEMDAYHAQYGQKFPGNAFSEDSNELLEDIGSDHRVKDGDHDYSFGFGSKAPPKQAPETTESETIPVTTATAAPEPKKSKFTYWRVLAGILVLLLVAEFVDKNIYNFTGTGGPPAIESE